MTRLISIKDTQERLRLGRTKVVELLNSGEIESVRIGSARRVVEDSVEAYIQRILTTNAPDRPQEGVPPDRSDRSNTPRRTHPE